MPNNKGLDAVVWLRVSGLSDAGGYGAVFAWVTPPVVVDDDEEFDVDWGSIVVWLVGGISPHW